MNELDSNSEAFKKAMEQYSPPDSPIFSLPPSNTQNVKLDPAFTWVLIITLGLIILGIIISVIISAIRNKGNKLEKSKDEENALPINLLQQLNLVHFVGNKMSALSPIFMQYMNMISKKGFTLAHECLTLSELQTPLCKFLSETDRKHHISFVKDLFQKLTLINYRGDNCDDDLVENFKSRFDALDKLVPEAVHE